MLLSNLGSSPSQTDLNASMLTPNKFISGSYPLGSGNVLLTDQDTLVVESLQGRQSVAQLQIPPSTLNCASGVNGVPHATSSRPAFVPCSNTPTAVATDGAGEAWIVGPDEGYLALLSPP